MLFINSHLDIQYRIYDVNPNIWVREQGRHGDLPLPLFFTPSLNTYQRKAFCTSVLT